MDCYTKWETTIPFAELSQKWMNIEYLHAKECSFSKVII